MTQGTLYEVLPFPKSVKPESLSHPKGYTGLYAIHKYWGKKPFEPLAFAIEALTDPGDLVVDPFVGSGTTAREAAIHGRRFIGFDINPVAVELSKLLLRVPDLDKLRIAFHQIEKSARNEIEKSYLLNDHQTVATHYIWDQERIIQTWVRHRRRGPKPAEYAAAIHDKILSASFSNYSSKHIRPPRFFSNGRINATPKMQTSDLLTGRAQRNIDLLIDAINACPEIEQRALKLCLTAASGQMSKMVFAVTGRGKTRGESTGRTEVGSWVIGFWRPKCHFEVNVWNCFENRVHKLMKALEDSPKGFDLAENSSEVLENTCSACIQCGDCRQLMRGIPDSSVDLIITDPPHGDRIPYLELSEFWNSILGFTPDFAREIVFSNAKERDKNSSIFTQELYESLCESKRLLTPDGLMVILFNGRNPDEWQALRQLCRDQKDGSLDYLGYFDCEYSTGSVVQDARKGSLRADYALIFGNGESSQTLAAIARLRTLTHWSTQMPENLRG